MSPEQSYNVVSLLNDIKKLLEKQNELLENQQQNPQTKITVVGNKANPTNKGLNSTDNFTL